MSQESALNIVIGFVALFALCMIAAGIFSGRKFTVVGRYTERN